MNIHLLYTMNLNTSFTTTPPPFYSTLAMPFELLDVDLRIFSSVLHVQHVHVRGLNLDNFIWPLPVGCEFSGELWDTARELMRLPRVHISDLKPNGFAAFIIVLCLPLMCSL